MQATVYDTPIFIDAKAKVTQDPVYGTEIVVWKSVTGKRPILAEFQDVLPSRSEAVKQGLAINSRQTRVRFPFISGIDSSMRLRVNRGVGDEKPVDMGDGTNSLPASVYQIIGGPALIGAKQEALEIVVEKYSS